MAPNNHTLDNLRPAPPGNVTVYIGDGTPQAVEYVESLDVVVHSNEDVRVTL